MNSCGNRFFSGILAIGIAGAAFVFLTGCGMDSQNVLTWSQDAKREGIKQYGDGRYAEAAGAFRNAIRQNPLDPDSEYWLGLCYERTQSWHAAIDAYKTCLQLMPPPGTVHYSLRMHDSAFDRVAHLIASNDSTGSETDLLVQTAAQSHSSEDFRLLGRVYRFRGDADNALENYRRAVQIEPENFAAQRELGLYLEQLTQNQEAGQVLRDAYRLNQTDERVNDALRQIGMEPGPGLLARRQPPARQMTMPPLPSVDPGLPTPAANSAGPSPDVAPPRE
jgi:cytochrome c-type biogenesis protein CcmH/NrfG